jgi:(1->4)-alpha-D-glucan 1-alpha-D-glucosylmutase
MQAIRSMHAEEGSGACAQHLMENLRDGRIKIYLTWKALTFRREHEQLFREGDYLPLKADGDCSEHVCVFARRHENEALVVAVPRLLGRLLGEQHQFPIGKSIWTNTWVELPADELREKWINVLTGETFTTQRVGKACRGFWLAQLFGMFPYALLSPFEQTTG